MRAALKIIVFVNVAYAALCVFACWAFAQEAPAPATNPNPAELVAWATVGYAAIGALVSIFRPDNTALPFQVSTAARAWIAVGGGVLEAALLGILHGTPWVQAILAAVSSALAAFATHGARVEPGATPEEAVLQKSHRPPPLARGFTTVHVLAAIIFLVGSAFACGLVRPGSPAEELASCEAQIAATHPGYTFEEYVAASLAACGKELGLTVLDVVNDILGSSDPALAKYKPRARAARDDHAVLGSLREKVGHE